MIKAVIFDCLGVLYVPKSDYLYQFLLANPSRHHDEIQDLVAQNEYGLIDDEALFEHIFRLTGVVLHTVKHSLVDGFVCNVPLMSYIESLRSHYKVALLSNLGTKSVVKFFPMSDREKLFDAFIISGEVGMIKPHPQIYEYTCKQLGVDVSEAVFVDDAKTNCDGARAAGLRAIHYESNWQVERTLEGVFNH